VELIRDVKGPKFFPEPERGPEPEGDSDQEPDPDPDQELSSALIPAPTPAPTPGLLLHLLLPAPLAHGSRKGDSASPTACGGPCGRPQVPSTHARGCAWGVPHALVVGGLVAGEPGEGGEEEEWGREGRPAWG